MADRWVVTQVTDDRSVGTLVNNVFASTKNFHSYEEVKTIAAEFKRKTRVAGNQETEFQIWLCYENGEREMVQVI